MKELSACLVLLLVYTGMFVSCKKDKDKKPTCRIVTITESSPNSTTVYNITYNNDGKISTLVTSGSSSGTTKVFTYAGNTINIHSTFGNGSTARDSITLDSRGRPLNIRNFADQSGANWTNLSFEYSGDDLLKYIQTGSSTTASETSTATSANGNIISLQRAFSQISFEYFMDKKVQPGDYLEIVTLIQYGVTIYPHKNLIKSLSADGGSVSNLNYEFDSDGKITKVIATSGSLIASLSYQYQCN